ncbi:hypothetical protein PN36_26070 [Candidatus Thiomargarita nelsonii]|uniref:Sulfatase-modifying factor enzyme-like domain-containing protein n=1 Tax=Candidatus Thiomargarita nelsonii TaxID=1003181 RepID=A0A0A6S6V9_9GAMM|nr:hypothetical protein PN36_26070 [Candidatus Thiomargarita nelsonii]
MAQQGVCKNYGDCQLADEKKPMSLESTNRICPDCGQPLYEIPSSSPLWLKISGGILIFLVLIVGGGVWWYVSPPVPTPTPKPPHPELTQSEKLRIKIEALQRQIDAIQAEIGNTPVHSLITQLEDIQGQIDQMPELQTQIVQIYIQLVENLSQEINRLQTQIGTNTHLATELESVQKHIKAIQSASAQLPETAALNQKIEGLQTQIEQIYTQLVDNMSQEINHLQTQIGTKALLELATELESVQQQMKAIQSGSAQLPDTSQLIALNQTIEERQTQIEQIYTQLVKEIQNPLEKIQAQVGHKKTVSLTTPLEKLQDQVWGIQRPISRFYGSHSLLYAQVSELQTRIEQIYRQLIDNINQTIEALPKPPFRHTSAVISVTTQLVEIQEPIDAVHKLLDKLYETEQVLALQKQVEKQQTGIEQTYRMLVSDIEKQIKAMPADKCTAPKQLQSQIETIQTQIEAIQQRIDKSIRRPEMAALKTRLDGLHRKVMRDLTEISSCSCVDEVPKCLSAEMQKKLPLSCVPTLQNRAIPGYLHDWIKGVAKVTESEFFVMRREVKVGEFQDYVKTLDKGQRDQLGDVWRQDDAGEVPDENPVAGVPWWAAKGYADWLSKKTGCPLTLPTYNQWIAATVSHANPDNAVIRDKQQFLGLKPQQRTDDGKKQASNDLFQQLLSDETEENAGGVLDLLGNLREWSIDNRGQEECPDDSFHYILGEDYKTWRDNIAGAPICEMGMSDMVGFRLVLRENK